MTTTMGKLGKHYQQMRNQKYDTAEPLVPVHLQAELDEVNEKIRIACEQQDLAQRRHNDAILARIALDSQATNLELQTASSQANQATKHYVAALAERIFVADKINAFVRELEEQRQAG